MNIVTIPLDRIDVGDRLRAVDEDYAQLIAASMQQDGQRAPIEVQAPGKDGRWRLIAGAHRCRAAYLAGLTEMQAVVLKVSDLDAKRLEIEENLCRHELTELDRGTFLAQWKEVYEALNEAARHGGKRRGKDQVGKDANLIGIERFTALAADRTGLSETMIQRATRRFRKLAPDVRERISGSWLANNGAELDLLARLPPTLQRKAIGLMEERGARSIRAICDEVMEKRTPIPDPDQAQFDALVKLWRRTGAKARRLFEAELAKDAMFNMGGDAA